MNVIIFTNGEYRNKKFYENYLKESKIDYIICADGGANFAKEINVVPNIILGDMDSITKETAAFYKDINVKTFSARKDETDTELAIIHAIEIGAKKVTLLGALGSRMDHSLGNIYLLKRIVNEGIVGEIINENNLIRLIIQNEVFRIPVGKTVSLLPIGGDVEGINISGFEYPIIDGRMTMERPYGISNVTSAESQQISFEKGMFLMILSND